MINTLPQKGEAGWYYRLSNYFREHFGRPVYKIPLDAGFSCPNRDGTIGKEGCSYCFNPSFSPHCHHENLLPLNAQLAKGRKNHSRALYLAYFQSYTNTYAPVETLRKLYDQALSAPGVIGLSIATRPDCLSAETLDLLEDYARRCHLWVEYGLQSAHDQTLKKINRGHNAATFEEAVTLTHRRGIRVCAHIILGLPGETSEMFAATIACINKLRVEGVKFHHLQVIRNTPLAREHAAGLIPVYDRLDDYIRPLCACLELLSPATVVHRLASQATSSDLLIAPHWPESSGQVAAAVTEELKKRGTHQGRLFKQ